jgi:hypothetical protein
MGETVNEDRSNLAECCREHIAMLQKLQQRWKAASSGEKVMLLEDVEKTCAAYAALLTEQE